MNVTFTRSVGRTVRSGSIFLFLLLQFFQGHAQTTLAQGDLSIIGIKANVVRGVAFVLWVPVSAGTEIRFTDNGFNSSSASTSTNNVRWVETVLIWTATSAVSAGTIITIMDETANLGTANAINATGADIVTVLNLSNTSGDQVFAYQGGNMPTTPSASATTIETFNNTILFGIGYQANSANTTWLTAGLASTATSHKPSDLDAGNAIYLTGNATVGEYTGARTGLGSAAAYKTAISNTANWTTASGTSATLTFNTTGFGLGVAPTIANHPSNSTICQGGNTSFTVTANNTTSYQWQENSGSGFTNISNGGVYSGATTATLTITGATALMSGYLYRCVATGSAAPTATSTMATLTVNLAPSITSAPTNKSLCAGGTTSFSTTIANATGYTWQANTGSGYTNITNGGVYSGQGTSTLTITGATAGMSGFMYRVIGSGTCTPSATSTGATLTVSNAPAVTQNPFPSAICEGDATLFYIAATNANSYQWQENSGSGYTNISNGGGISGATSSVMIINNISVSLSGNTYRCVVSGVCSPSATSTGAALTVFANVTYYEDFDGDGYGNASVTTVSCTGAPGGFVANFDDCDDNNNQVYPGAVEICDGIDNDCDGTVDVVGTLTWTGAISSDWSNPANWNCGTIPTASTDVIISSGVFNPSVNIADAVCRDITINSGASLFILAGSALDIKGNVSNSGTFTSLGEAVFSGGSQTIPGGTFNSLVIGGTGTKTLTGSVLVFGAVTLNSSMVELGSYNLRTTPIASITGASASSFIVVNGTGSLIQSGIGNGNRTGAVLFPIGVSSSSYTPVSVDNSTGTSDEFAVRVISGVNKTYDGSGNPTGVAQTTFNVDRTWLVSEFTPGGSNATLSFQWNATEEQSGFIRSSCFASHYVNGVWQRGPTNQSASGSDPYTLSLSGVTSFSPFGVGSPGSTLPAQLLTFRVKEESGKAILNWTSENEISTSHFEIQRSIDGTNFGSVGEVAARNIAGTHEYSFTDAGILNQTYYYRLRIVDTDRQFTYSGILVLSASAQAEGLRLFPNPVIDKANLLVNLSQPANARLILSDNTGRIVRQWNQQLSIGSNSTSVSMEGMSSGVYYLEMKAGPLQQRVKLFKQ